MGLFYFFRRFDAPGPPILPIFPLNTVLFPGGLLKLQVFETRYLDMASACLRKKTPFGICLAKAGQEGEALVQPHPVGTLAEIVQADMEQAGILLLTVRGGERFRILSGEAQANQLLKAEVEYLPVPPKLAPPPERSRLMPLLIRIISDLGPEKMPEPHAFDDAEWIGYRLTEVLPVPNLAKQKLLELENPLTRLEILERYLADHQLLGTK